MLIAATTVLVGFIILIWSADLFVAGAASIAENLGMSPIIIGLTIVSLGTSAPEILVSLTAAMSDAGDPRIQTLLDEREIRRLFARYCRGIDRLDEDLVLTRETERRSGRCEVPTRFGPDRRCR